MQEKTDNKDVLIHEPPPISDVDLEDNRPFWARLGLDKVVFFLISIILFILALILMKNGAEAFSPLIQNHFSIDTIANSLGFGWFFAYILMSGSPVAAAALTFFDAGILNKVNTYFMITGSRLGASFIVLFVGFVYVFRGRSRASSLGMGLLSLIVTGTTYLAALLVGIWLLGNGVLDGIRLQSGANLNSVLDMIFGPLINFLLSRLPQWSLFVLGMGLIIFSFNLFDKAVPQMSLSESQIGKVGQLVYRPWVMFILGALITLISMSVSVSLAILVPLSQRGFVRRENVIPYIMGANVTTFVDTLFAAVLLNNPAAFEIVLVQMVSITIVSLIILVLDYGRFQHEILRFVGWISSGKTQFVVFMFFILVIPLVLLLI